ncbi:MAG: DUF1592 domain-containing protein [Planctomycetaceae bacterium]
MKKSASIILLYLCCSTQILIAQSGSVRSFLNNHCAGCHSGDEAESGLDISTLKLDGNSPASLEHWTRILDRVQDEEMPPPEEEQPNAVTRVRFVNALRKTLVTANHRRYKAMGRTTVRRLNRHEYERTVQDLLDITIPLAHMLPEDNALHGFDTVSDGLRFSSLHIDKYLDAADAAVHAALRFTKEPERIDKRFLFAEQEGIRQNVNEGNSVVRNVGYGAVLFTDASYITKVHGLSIKTGGMYRIRAKGQAFQSAKPVVMRLHAGDYKSGTVRMLGFFDMPPNESREVELTTRLEWNNYLYPSPDDLEADPSNKGVWNVGAETFGGSGLLVEWVEIEGPLNEKWPPSSVGKLLGDTPIEKLKQKRWTNDETIWFEPRPTDAKASIRVLLTNFAERAFRRPLEPGEADLSIKLALDSLESGRSFEDAMRIGAKAILTSPRFLILDESPGVLSGYQLASRLSYFLWGTMPDEELMSLAKTGELTKSEVLREQTERLLQDDRSKAFVQSFAGQWLDLRSIDNTSPDKRLYPEFDEILKLSMVSETEQFFAELMREDLPVHNFIDSDFAMLNRRLSRHYEIDDVDGQQIQRVALPEDSPRGGVMTQAAVLKVTANGTVTSPVTRGSWVISRLLNEPPSPPPPSVGAIEPDTRGATTVREQLAKHRSDASCNSCHATIDPPGFALESFDVIGGWRERYRSKEKGDRPEYKLNGRQIWEYKLGPQVDSSGELKSGDKFADIREFKALLMNRKDQVARSLAEKLLVYATGHQIEIADRPTVEKVLAETQETEHGLRSMIHEVVQSALFRNK